jgi:hypothetical protein
LIGRGRFYGPSRDPKLSHTVFGVEQALAETMMAEIIGRCARALGRHQDDRVLDP